MIGWERKTPNSKRTTTEILKDVHETLKTAELGLAMVTKGPTELKLCGLYKIEQEKGSCRCLSI
jgi:hypothetical protein